MQTTGTLEAPVLDGPGPTLEYGMRMRRLAAGDVDRLAALLANFHERMPSADATSHFLRWHAGDDGSQIRLCATSDRDGVAGFSVLLR